MRMKKIIAVIVAISTIAPAGAGAVVINTSASANSGGVTANQEEAVATEPSQSSSNIRTVIISDERGGTADVQITTTRDGVQSVEKTHYETPAGAAVEIRAATTSTVKARVRASSTMPVTPTASSSNATTSQVRSANVFLAWLNQAPWSFTAIFSRFMSLFSR